MKEDSYNKKRIFNFACWVSNWFKTPYYECNWVSISL